MFGAIKVTEDPSDSDHNKYFGYGICFDQGSSFSFLNIQNGKNVLGKDFIQGVTTVGPTALSAKTSKGTTIYAEKLYKHNFTEPNKTFVMSLHYNGDNSYLFVNGGEELKFKVKTFNNEMKQNILRLGNLSSNWSSANSTKTGLYGSVCDFAVDYSPVDSVGRIHDIHRYFMKKHDII